MKQAGQDMSEQEIKDLIKAVDRSGMALPFNGDTINQLEEGMEESSLGENSGLFEGCLAKKDVCASVTEISY